MLDRPPRPFIVDEKSQFHLPTAVAESLRMLLIISIVLIVYGLAIVFGKVSVFEKASTQLCFGFGLLLLAVVLIFLMVRFPHG